MIFQSYNNSNNNQTFRLTTGGAKNFENLGGDPGASETLYGDSNDNIIAGGGFGYGMNDQSPSAGSKADKLYGEAGNDTLYGNGELYGGAGNDTLYGSTSNDTLDGGTGADTITSGTGSDTIVLRAGGGEVAWRMLTLSRTLLMAPMFALDESMFIISQLPGNGPMPMILLSAGSGTFLQRGECPVTIYSVTSSTSKL